MARYDINNHYVLCLDEKNTKQIFMIHDKRKILVAKYNNGSNNNNSSISSISGSRVKHLYK